MEIEKNISFFIVELRNKLGISRVSFAKNLGLSTTQMKRMEVGTVIPNEEFVKKICEVYHVNPVYFDGKMDIDEAVSVTDPEEEKKQVGSRVRQVRIDNKKTLKELSSLIGLSESQLSLIENGEYKLTEKRAVGIAEVLHVGVDWLLHGDETKKKDPIDQIMIEWLWNHPEVREEIWAQILNNRKNEENEVEKN